MSNLNKVRNINPVYLELDKVRQLKFDLNAFAELEKKFGSVEAAMAELEKGSMKSIITVVWIGLIHEEAVFDDTGEVVRYNLTQYQVGSMIPPSMLEEVSEKLAIAMGGALPEVAPSNKTKQKGLPKADPKMATVVLTDEEKEQERKND